MTDAEPLDILIVEDNSDTAKTLAWLIGSLAPKLSVEGASSLKQARELVRTRRPRNCVIDLGLPDGNGLDFLREVKAVLPFTRAVICTGRKDDRTHRDAIVAGADEYLIKPLDADTVLKALEIEPNVAGKEGGQS